MSNVIFEYVFDDKLDFEHLFICSSRPITCIHDMNWWQNSQLGGSYVKHMINEHLEKKGSKQGKNLMKLDSD